MNAQPLVINAIRDAAADLDIASQMSASSMGLAVCRASAIARRAGDLRLIHARLQALQSEATVVAAMYHKWLLLGMSDEQMHQRARELRADLAALGLLLTRATEQNECNRPSE